MTAGQLLDDLLIQIRADSIDANIQSRFAEQTCADQSLTLHTIEDKIVKTLAVHEILPQLISRGVASQHARERHHKVSAVLH